MDDTNIEAKVKAATNNDPGMPSKIQMQELAEHTYSECLQEVMNRLWHQLFDEKSGKNWKRVYKSLIVLEYLLECGSEDVVNETRSRILSLQTLLKCSDNKRNKDKWALVVEKAQEVLNLTLDTKRLRQQRKATLDTNEFYGQEINNQDEENINQNYEEHAIEVKQSSRKNSRSQYDMDNLSDDFLDVLKYLANDSFAITISLFIVFITFCLSS